MLRRQPGLLLRLLLILPLVACTTEMISDEPATPVAKPVITADSTVDAPEQASAEPPPAILTIDGWEQMAGITSYCWQQGGGTGLCADAVGVTTGPDPIPAGSTFLAEFEMLLEASPGRVQLSIFPASQPAANAHESSDWRYWSPVPGALFTLPGRQNPSIELTLEPGLYVFNLSVDWPDHGEVSYGFLVDVESAMRREVEMQRMQWQETIGEVQPVLMADLPGTYGGLWVEEQPDYRIVIALTEGDLETIRPYLAGYEWADFVEVQPVNYTLEELRADQIVASQAAETVQVLATTAVDIVNNRVELIVGNPGLFYTDLDQAGIELPESVVVLVSDPEGELPDTNRRRCCGGYPVPVRFC